MEFIPIVFIVVIIGAPVSIKLYDWIHGTNYVCSILGWHNGKGSAIGFDGCSATSSCSKCGKSVLQDSQGNWF